MVLTSPGNRCVARLLIGCLGLWTPASLWALEVAPAAAQPEPSLQDELAPPLPQPTRSLAPDVEPPPEMPGPALLITGWSMFGTGTIYAAVFGLLWANSDTCFNVGSCRTTERSPTLLVYTGIFGTIAFTGLALALIGHQRRAEARENIELWESQHGKRPDLGQRLRQNGQWSALTLSDGGMGLGWSTRF